MDLSLVLNHSYLGNLEVLKGFLGAFKPLFDLLLALADEPFSVEIAAAHETHSHDSMLKARVNLLSKGTRAALIRLISFLCLRQLVLRSDYILKVGPRDENLEPCDFEAHNEHPVLLSLDARIKLKVIHWAELHVPLECEALCLRLILLRCLSLRDNMKL